MFQIRSRRSHFYLNGSTKRASPSNQRAPQHIQKHSMCDKQYQRKSFDFLRRYILFYVKHRIARAEREDMDSDRLEDRIISTLNKTSYLSGSSSLHSASRQRSFASAIMLSEPFQRFSVRKPTRNYILQHKTCFKTPQSPSVISYDHFQGNSASIQINHFPNCAFNPYAQRVDRNIDPVTLRKP